MRKIIPIFLILLLGFSLCACGSKSNDEIIEGQQVIIDDQNRTIEEFQIMLDEVQMILQERDNTINNLVAENERLQQKLSDLQQEISPYTTIINYLQRGNYEYVISAVEQMEEDAWIAEMESRGIEEITVTIENWDEYFEYTPNSYVYITNAFGEVDVINFTGGIKLKEGYVLADNAGSRVNFEFESRTETRECTIDFETGEVEFGKIVSVADRVTTYTTAFSDHTWSLKTKTVSFGQIYQAQNGTERIVKTEKNVCNVSKMLRVQGTLYLYKTSN